MPRTRRQVPPASDPAQTDIEDAIKATPSVSPADLIKEHQELKAWKDAQTKAFNEFMKPHNDKLEQISNQLLQMALDQKVNGFPTEFGTGYISQGIAHKVDPNAAATWTNPDTGEVETGREALLDWMLAHWEQYGAEWGQISIGIDGVKAYMEATKSEEHPEGLLPPGISIERWKRFNIRKS